MKETALIFDLDGTLWDSSQSVAEIWTIKGKKSIDPNFSLTKEDVQALMGKTMKDILLSIAPKLSEDERSRIGEELLLSENDYLVDHPGVLFPEELETLNSLREEGYRLFIVSNCQLGYIEKFLSLVPEALFEGHLCWGDTHDEKAVTIRRLMKERNISKAIYIGDTNGDENASNRAGIPFFHAKYGFGNAEKPAVVLPSLSSLPEALRAYFDQR